MADYSLSAMITADSSGFTTAINKAKQSLSALGKKMSEVQTDIAKSTKEWGLDFGKFYNTGSDLFKKFGLDLDVFAGKLGMTGPVVASITAATVALGKLGLAMDEATAEIVKGTGATGEVLDGLEQSFRNALINGVGAPASEVAGVVADLNTRFGITGDDLTELTGTFDDFAGVTGQDTREAIADVADVMAKWDVKTKSTSLLLDQLTKASQDSGASVQELNSSLKSGQAVFSQFGMGITESIAFLSNLKKSGVDSQTAIQAMRVAMVNFSKEGKEPQKALEEIGEKIRNATSKTEAMSLAIDTFGNKAGAEMVKVFQSGAMSVSEYTKALNESAGAVAKTDEASRTMIDAWNDFKATLTGSFGQFGQAISAVGKGILDIARMIFEKVAPIIDAIGGIFRTVVSGIVNNVVQIVKAWSDLAKRLNLGGKGITTVLNAIKKVFSAVFGAISWIVDKAYRLIAIAIDGMKIGFLNFVKVIAPILNPIIKGLKSGFNEIIKLINKFVETINDALDFFGAESFKLPEMKLLNAEESPIDEKAINEDITALKADINDLLKGTKEQVIETNDAVYSSTETMFDAIEAGASNATEAVKKEYEDIEKWEDKLLAQKLANLEKERDNTLQTLRNEGTAAEKVLETEKKYNEAILKLKEEQINRERKNALESVKGKENAKQAELKINQYYDGEIEKLHAKTVQAIQKQEEKKYDLLADYADKFKAQTQKIMEAEERYALNNAKTEEEKEQIRASFAEKRYQMAVRETKLEKQKAILKARQNGADAESIKLIEEYYATEIMLLEETQILSKQKNSEQQNDMEKQEGGIVSLYIVVKKVISKIADIGKAVYKVVSTAVNLTMKAYKGLYNGVVGIGKKTVEVFKKMFEFDADESLNSVLEYEDKILTFFHEGASKIPSFVLSVIDSVESLVGNVTEMIDFDKISEVFGTLIQTAAEKIPQLTSKIIPLMSNMLKTVAGSLSKNAGVIASGVGDMIKTVIKELPSLIKSVVPAIVGILRELLDSLMSDSDSLIDAFVSSFDAIINAVVEFLSNGGLAKLIKGFISMMMALVQAIANNVEPIVQAFVDALPAIVDGIVEVLKNVHDILPKVMNALVKLITGIIEALAELLGDEKFVGELIDTIADLVEMIAVALVELIPVILKALIKIAIAIVKNIPKIMKRIYTVLFNVFKNVDWGKMWEGLVDSVKTLGNGFKSIFSGIGSTIFDIFSNLGARIWSIFSNIGSSIQNVFSSLAETVVAVVKAPVNALIKALNWCISKINSILQINIPSVSLPWWLGGHSFGGWHWGVDLPMIPEFKNGTNSAPNGLALVGEAGPELVRFNGGEQVLNTRNTQKALGDMGGKSNVFNVTFNNTTDTSAYAMIRQLKQYNRQLAINGII